MEVELSRRIGRNVDLVVFSQADPVLKHEILKPKRMICEGDRFVERYVYLGTEAVLDTANHIIISQERWREPKGYADLFAILAEHVVIPEDRLPGFQRMAGFRNILVHRYEKAEDAIVYGVFRNHLDV